MTLCPKPLQKKALKVVAAKLALAIRMDHVAQSTTMPTAAARAAATRQGLAFRQDILQKIQAWQEPQKAMVIKALPKPDLTIKKRRGGKRMRRIKERFEETNMMKQANTRSFSGPTGEYGDDAMGLTLGLLDGGGDASAIGAEGATNASGALRKHAVEKRKLRQANTKASRKRAAQLSSQAASAGSAGSSGLASSMVFTPVQGMELVDPDANRDRVREANRKWFTEHGGFQSALPQSSLLSKKK
jgi:U4/U6 small nuclear ribonucleoprotein PRP31